MDEYRAEANWPYHISCGGAVFRKNQGTREYALLFRGERFGDFGNSWHLPKGTLHKNESLESAALREIREESGLTVEIIGYLGALHRVGMHGNGRYPMDKTTHYFLCRHLEGDGSLMDYEHDRVEWHPAKEAAALLDRVPKEEGKIIRRSEDFLANLQ